MLSELKRGIEQSAVEQVNTYREMLDKIKEHDFGIRDDVNHVTYAYRNHQVLVKGIPVDYKIYLDNKIVCEIVYNDIYVHDKTLLRLLME